MSFNNGHISLLEEGCQSMNAKNDCIILLEEGRRA
jgi:hypothetical protein